jgi:hypothetical protein
MFDQPLKERLAAQTKKVITTGIEPVRTLREDFFKMCHLAKLGHHHPPPDAIQTFARF